jgi:hypothetical protein
MMTSIAFPYDAAPYRTTCAVHKLEREGFVCSHGCVIVYGQYECTEPMKRGGVQLAPASVRSISLSRLKVLKKNLS